jgi:glucose dehydrogenase
MRVRRQHIRGKAAAWALGAAVLALAAGCGGSGASTTGSPQAPPEWAPNVADWPGHNYNLLNTRATTHSRINSNDVFQLRVKWRFRLTGSGLFGLMSSTPIVLGGTLYAQDLVSNVYAVDVATGKLLWRHNFNSLTVGPNGVAYGWGRIYGATGDGAFALDAATGKLVWKRKLTLNKFEGVDVAPQVYDHTVLVSTVPGNGEAIYHGTSRGIQYALDAKTGATKWSFETVKGGKQLFGNYKVNSGGGVWYPPGVDSKGRVFITTGNPGPYPGTAKFPDGASRPGPDLYTDSLVALDGKTGKLLWYRQVSPHDSRNYDLAVSPIVATVKLGGASTEIVMVGSKNGFAYAYRAADGKPVWKVSVGKHNQYDHGPLPKNVVVMYPGDTGGILTPMAYAHGTLYIPWVDLGAKISATKYVGYGDIKKSSAGIAAVDASTGRFLWKHKLPLLGFGGVTIANDVLFTSTFDGTMWALSTKTGKVLWATHAKAGINGWPAIAGDTVILPAGAPGFYKKPVYELIAYALD